jgi:hypothetical protein
MSDSPTPPLAGVPTAEAEEPVSPVIHAPRTAPLSSAISVIESNKLFVATWLFAWLLGIFAVDRFYLGKIGTGLLKLLTFSGLGIWWLVDLIIVLAGNQRDKQGHPLAGYTQHKKIAWIVTGAAIVISTIFSSLTAGQSANTASSPVAVEQPAQSPPSDAGVPQATAEAAAPVDEDVATAQSWADDAFGTFAPVTQTGAGDNIVALPAGATAGIVTATHDGSSNFSLSVLDAANASTGQLLVNTIGAYNGTTDYGFNAFGEGTTIQVTADGNWSLTIAPISASPLLTSSGTGDGVFLYEGKAGKLTATHNGASNFAVIEETGKAFSMGLLINEIGAYTGTVPLSSGPSVVAVTADGNWTLAVE